MTDIQDILDGASHFVDKTQHFNLRIINIEKRVLSGANAVLLTFQESSSCKSTLVVFFIYFS